jgi:membrane-associated protein
MIEFIQNHAQHAHYVLFGLALLAGMNVPISIDLLMIAGATLASTLIPEHLYLLFFFLFAGCSLSAWIAYALGRFFGIRLMNTRYFSKILNQKRIDQINEFYNTRGFWTLFFGRFIPFGVRNALYMSSGMSKLSFRNLPFGMDLLVSSGA